MAINTVKKCYECQLDKPLTDYYNKGKDIYCKYCRVAHSLKSHLNDTKKRRCSFPNCDGPHYARDYCRTHYSRFARNKTPEGLYGISPKEDWEYNLKYNYGLTPGRFKDMSKHGCNVCKAKASGVVKRRLQVDHDHTYQGGFPIPKEYIRGVVCHACNTALGKYDTGLLRDDNPRKSKIMKYIARYDKRKARRGR